MSNNLTPITSFCDANLGSYQFIDYLPVDWVDTSLYDHRVSGAYNQLAAIPLLYGAWLRMPVYSPQTKRWDEKEKTGKYGASYEQTVTGIIPMLRPAVTGEFNKMSKRRFLLKLTDKNQQPWLLGSLESPFRFKANGTSGDSIRGLNNYSIRFFTETKDRAVGYIPVF